MVQKTWFESRVNLLVDTSGREATLGAYIGGIDDAYPNSAHLNAPESEVLAMKPQVIHGVEKGRFFPFFNLLRHLYSKWLGA